VRDGLVEHLHELVLPLQLFHWPLGTHAKELVLTGLSEQAIGEWIKSVKGVELPFSPHIMRIRQNSAGFPMLLKEWINQSEDLNYNEIDRSKLCEYISARKRGLGDNTDDKVKLNKIALFGIDMEMYLLLKKSTEYQEMY
jgi:hypothetical protein